MSRRSWVLIIAVILILSEFLLAGSADVTSSSLLTGSADLSSSNNAGANGSSGHLVISKARNGATLGGRQTIIDSIPAPGSSHVGLAWDGLDNNNHPVVSGVYFYKLTAENRTTSKKMVIIK